MINEEVLIREQTQTNCFSSVLSLIKRIIVGVFGFKLLGTE